MKVINQLYTNGNPNVEIQIYFNILVDNPKLPKYKIFQMKIKCEITREFPSMKFSSKKKFHIRNNILYLYIENVGCMYVCRQL